jgi:broad specificity phosphatase PhoE
MKLRNNYFILRHGEARSNKEEFVSSWPEKVHNPLTEKGVEQVKKIVPKIKRENIDLIFSSDLLRTKQTAEIITKELGLKIDFDKRLREYNMGIFNGKSGEKWLDFVAKNDRFRERPPQGENWADIRERSEEFIKIVEKKYKNKKILIISHQDPLLLFEAIIRRITNRKILEDRNKLRLKEGELKIL